MSFVFLHYLGTYLFLCEAHMEVRTTFEELVPFFHLVWGRVSYFCWTVFRLAVPQASWELPCSASVYPRILGWQMWATTCGCPLFLVIRLACRKLLSAESSCQSSSLFGVVWGSNLELSACYMSYISALTCKLWGNKFLSHMKEWVSKMNVSIV